MKGVFLIADREFKAMVRSPLFFIAAAGALLGDGLWFLVKGLGVGQNKRLSAQVLSEFFNGTTGVVLILAVALGMRLLAREREQGTLVLLKTSPLSDAQIVWGKFLALMGVLALILAFTAYMPALIFVNGRVSVGHIAVGYFGVLCLASAASAISLFSSALAKNQAIAAVMATLLIVVMLMLWLLAEISEPPVSGLLHELAMHHKHQRDFIRGVLRLKHGVYYAALTSFFLLAASKTLEARRWR